MRNLLYTLCFLVSFVGFSQQKYKVGDAIPEFKLWLIDGNRVTKKDIKNKVVVFKFWFTTCLPCVVDISTLNEFVEELKEQDDILFIAPALDRKEVVKDFIKKRPFNFKIAYSSIEASQLLNPKQVYPTYIVIDKKGKFTYIDSSSKKSSFITLKKAVLKALKE